MTTLILCAAGKGTRAGLPGNKVLFELNGMPVLSYSLSAFAPYADEMLVVCRREDEKRILPLLAPYGNARTVTGGETRAESVLFALREARGDVVLVHDAARPFVTKKIIEDCLCSVKEYGSGVCALPATDTTVLAKDMIELGVHMSRSDLFTLQTPQGFQTDKLRAAYEKALSRGKLGEYTDDSMLYNVHTGEQPHLFLGDRCNRKLTYTEDFMPCERVGFGADTHAFKYQHEIDAGIARLNLNYIRLCGVTVPSNRAIEAHSDGDVPVHALMDALLSAMGERDIGVHFPDSDPAYKGADSMNLLGTVMDMVRAKGLKVQNVSISILCEQPRLSPYIDAMRESLKRALGCDCVAVAAGTNEKLGYIGEGRGITAYAMVLLGRDPSASPGMT